MELAQLTNDDGLAIRSMQVRASDTEAREFTGIGVPWNNPVEIRDWFGSYTEEFERGAVEMPEGGAKIFWRHGEIIGRVTAGRDTETGYEIDAKISDTTLGRDAYAMLRDGTIDQLSIGFRPIEWRESEDGTIVHTKTRAVEFSLVPTPAYDNAKVTAVRAAGKTTTAPKGNTMPEDVLTRADLGPVNDSLDELKRTVSTLGQNNTGPAAPLFRSMGEFLKAIANRDEEALEFHRAYTGATTADTVMNESFVGDYIKLVDERRRLVNTFTRGTLPPDGETVSYTQLKSNDVKVGRQVNQGDDLPYGKVQLQKATAPVHTYGGYTELSLQAIERASVPSLNTTFRAMAIAYARETEKALRTAYLAVIATNLASAEAGSSITLPATGTTDEWLDLIVDASEVYEERGFVLTGMHVSKDQFKQLIRLKDGDRRLMTVQGEGVNQVGRLDLTQLQGQIATLPVSILSGPAEQRASFYDPVALETLESPGAPAQLQDQNIINLTKQFSLYGYLANLNPFPTAILPVKFAV